MEITEFSWNCEIIVLMILLQFWKVFFKTTDHDCHWETREIVKDFQDSQIMVLMVHTCISKKKNFKSFDHDAHAAHRPKDSEWSENCMIMMLMNSERCPFRWTDHDSHATKIQIVLSKPTDHDSHHSHATKIQIVLSKPTDHNAHALFFTIHPFKYFCEINFKAN